MDISALITIGQAARRAGVTTKALRHYDRIGLLAPAAVDPATGYRYYTAAQVEQARVVGRLRGADVPLDEVRACLTGGPDEVHRVLTAHRRRLQARFDRVLGELHRLDHLLTDGVTAPMTDTPALTDQRQLAVDLFNGVWRLLESDDRSPADDDRMLHMAHASRYHWGEVGEPVNRSRGEWQCSRVYAVLARPEPATHHARRGLAICEEHGLKDWDLAFAYESLARAAAVAGQPAEAREWTEQALAVTIADPEDRALLLTDLESIPHQARFW